MKMACYIGVRWGMEGEVVELETETKTITTNGPAVKVVAFRWGLRKTKVHCWC